jgi:hypothetical protein
MPEMIAKAYDFILKNGRLLDRQLFSCLFLGGSQQAVIQALLAYQNPDGGFGNALEPDKRCPESQPVDQEFALKVLEMIGACQHTCVLQVCDFLQSITTPEGGVPYALPSVEKYPRAPWWHAPAEPPAALNPTAALAGMLLAHGIQHTWLDHAVPYCWQVIAACESTEYHDLLPVITFLQHAPDPQRAAPELERIGRIIADHQLVCMDPEAGGYVHPLLDWAPTPGHWVRGLFSDAVVQADLDRLLAGQQEDGGWDITWTPVSPAVALEWRGWRTVEALYSLKAYGVEVA